MVISLSMCDFVSSGFLSALDDKYRHVVIWNTSETAARRGLKVDELTRFKVSLFATAFMSMRLMWLLCSRRAFSPYSARLKCASIGL